MVDFTKPLEVQRWLRGQPQGISTSLAARAALRVLPLIVTDETASSARQFSTALVLPCFRAAATSWTSARFPHRSRELRPGAEAAVRMAHKAAAAAFTVVGSEPDANRVANVARAAASAAAAAVAITMRDSSAHDALTRDADAAISYAGSVDTLLRAAAANEASTIEQGDISLDRGSIAKQLACTSLWWPGGTPNSVVNAWTRLRTMLVLAGDDWEVWIDWYEDRLAGYDADPEIELARVMLPEEFWKQGPKAVNAEIKRLIEEARRGSPELPAEPIPAQGAGPHFAFAPNGKIALAPATEIDADGNHIGRMRQLLPIARRAADRLITHLGSTNAYVELAQDVRDYRAAIDGEPERIAWGIVFGLGVMLENATEAARRAIEDRLKPALEDPAQSALDSLLSLHGPLILASAEGRELADDANQMHQTRDEQARLRADVQVVARGLKGAAEIVEPPAADIVGKAADAIGGGRHPERGTVFGIATIGNVTIGLVGVAAASLLLGAPVVASAVGAGVTLIGVEAVKKSEKFSSLTSMLGQNIDRVLGLGGAYRRFVIANQEPLRRIAMDTQQLRWMLPHIDRIVESEAAEQHDGREE